MLQELASQTFSSLLGLFLADSDLHSIESVFLHRVNLSHLETVDVDHCHRYNGTPLVKQLRHPYLITDQATAPAVHPNGCNWLQRVVLVDHVFVVSELRLQGSGVCRREVRVVCF